MHKFKDHFHSLFPAFLFENILNVIVGIMIVVMLILSTYALLRPVNTQQYSQVLKYSHQAAYPKTQKMAQELRDQDSIHVHQYLRLLRAYHFENHSIKEYPALDSANPQQ